jgi:hypothetical protein
MLMASYGIEPYGRGRRREAIRRAVRVTPCRGVQPQERIVVWSQAARQGESKENLKVGQAGPTPQRIADDEEGRAKPIRHYTGSLIKL